MSCSDGRLRALRVAMLAAAAALLAGCTAGPLYGGGSVAPVAYSPGGGPSESLRGRFSIAPVDDRTTQVVRNALLFRLNGGATPSEPLYDVRIAAYGNSTNVQIDTDGVPSASVYQLATTYLVTRRSDNVAIGSGRRFVVVPFDRSNQLFAGSRALLDARQQAGDEMGGQLELAIANVIRNPQPGAKPQPVPRRLLTSDNLEDAITYTQRPNPVLQR